MVKRNIIRPVIEETMQNGTSLKSSRTNYNFWENNAWATSVKPLIVPQSFTTKLDANNWDERIKYERYNNKGDVLTLSKGDGPKTTYVYSYKGEYPIAKIENADYSAVEYYLGGSAAVETFRNKANPSATEINTFLAPLRDNHAFKGCMVTSYTYKPLVGMTSETDPKRQTTTYEYDSFQRLKLIKDHFGNIIKRFDYHYKN